MSRSSFSKLMTAHAAAGLLAVCLAAPAAAQSKPHTITLTISEVTAKDFIDWGLAGQADFYAKVTIAGETFTTPRIRANNAIKPDWALTKQVAPGRHDVRIEIFDRDPLKLDDAVDINRLANKRPLDFSINTRSCRLLGFSEGYRCGDTVKRTGAERKRAEIAFNVKVAR